MKVHFENERIEDGRTNGDWNFRLASNPDFCCEQIESCWGKSIASNSVQSMVDDGHPSIILVWKDMRRTYTKEVISYCPFCAAEIDIRCDTIDDNQFRPSKVLEDINERFMSVECDVFDKVFENTGYSIDDIQSNTAWPYDDVRLAIRTLLDDGWIKREKRPDGGWVYETTPVMNDLVEDYRSESE